MSLPTVLVMESMSQGRPSVGQVILKFPPVPIWQIWILRDCAVVILTVGDFPASEGLSQWGQFDPSVFL